jgi:hypothetical protein
MKFITYIALVLIPIFSYADDLLAVEEMNLNGALHAIGAGNYDQFLKFGTAELKKNITKSDFDQLHQNVKSKIIEGYATKLIGSQKWNDKDLMTHFIMIQFRTPKHEDYSTMLLELKTIPPGKKTGEPLGKIIDITITEPTE